MPLLRFPLYSGFLLLTLASIACSVELAPLGNEVPDESGGPALEGESPAAPADGGAGGGGPTTTVECHEGDEVTGTPGSCEAVDTNNECQLCVQQQCCEEQATCNSSGPDSACGFGSTLFDSRVVETGEIGCVMECLANRTDEGLYSGSADDLEACEADCGASECGSGTISSPTVRLAECIVGLKEGSDGCSVACGFLP